MISRQGQEGGEAMRKEFQGWILFKVWLSSPRVAVWGRRVGRRFHFYPHSLGDVESGFGIKDPGVPGRLEADPLT